MTVIYNSGLNNNSHAQKGNMPDIVLLVLYLSSFICLCALVCLYFSGCQEMTYKHDGKSAKCISVSKCSDRSTSFRALCVCGLILFSVCYCA